MRHLLLKDLQILRRSPLVSALLVIYPVAIAILIGFALSDEGGKPRVAFYNEVPEDAAFNVGGGEESLDRGIARDELCDRVECVDVSSREEAEKKVEDGEVLGALIVPEDILDKLQSLTSLDPEQPTVEVLVNEDDPVKAQLVDDRIQALITEANLILAQRISESAEVYLNVLIEGGDFDIPLLGQTFSVLGLENAATILEEAQGELPPNSDGAKQIDQVIEFAELAGDNLDFALPLLGAVASPIEVNKTVVAGRRHLARRVRDLGRGDGDADVRDGAARRRLAGARAGGERLPAPHARPHLARRAPGREGPTGRGRIAGGDAPDARRPLVIRLDRLGADRAHPGRDRDGWGSLRRVRRRARGRRP